ncbi:globin-1-like, partial [Ruditapes philippinarum]|uniref:globin-1-like n=1 Tax=Ruditapes philippinarum TaxID=129788 RepID=UPI00295A7F70
KRSFDEEIIKRKIEAAKKPYKSCWINSRNWYRLFANKPKIKEAFTNCDIKLQSGLFGKMVQSWMENLDNAGTLDQKVSGMCDSHKKRGTTDMGLFKDALTELAGFVSDTVEMNGDQQTSWQKINESILDVMKTKF